MTPRAKRFSRSEDLSPAFVPPYPPSWVDRFTDGVDRMRLPWWSFYLILALVIEAINVSILGVTGAFRVYGVLFFPLFSPVNFVLAMFLMHAFDRQAKSALERFRPALRPDALPFPRLLYELTTLPRWPAILAGLIGVLFGLLAFGVVPRGLTAYPVYESPAGRAFAVAISIPTAWLWFTLVYHTIHQLTTVHRIYTRQAQVDLYRLQPIHALSGLAAVTALGFAAYTYPWITNPGAQPGAQGAAGVSFLLTAPFYVWPILVFVWPLWGAHRLLAQHKAAALDDLGRRRQSLSASFHKQMDRRPLNGMDEFHNALATLDLETAAVERIPTWPWPRGMFRNLVAAFMLPVFIWLIQYALQRILG